MEEASCDCNVDPLTFTGRFKQLAGMIGGPLLPGIVLVIYSVVRLQTAVAIYNSDRVAADSMSRVAATYALILSLHNEMDGSTAYYGSNGSDVLGSLPEFYQTTDDAVYHTQPWMNGESPFATREQLMATLHAHRSEATIGNSTVSQQLNFYRSIMEGIMSWGRHTLDGNILRRAWRKMVAFEFLIKSSVGVAVERSVGSVYFLRGSLVADEHVLFLQATELGHDHLAMAAQFDPSVSQAIANLQPRIAVFQDLRLAVEQNADSAPSLYSAVIWFRQVSAFKTAVDDNILAMGDEVKKTIEELKREALTEIGLQVAAVGLIVLLVVPFVVVAALRTTDALYSYAYTMEKKGRELKREKRKTERLLNEMLPRMVSYRLRNGEVVDAESYTTATVFFSDIADFSEISAESAPIDIIIFLNDLYSWMDEQIITFDVYKVETIGCVYMVVSGIPSRNGNRHSTEIASLALELIDSAQDFDIPHLPDRHLMIRIGVHTGPVVAGVVGIKSPRYCLFGDTVNTASRMQSTGAASRIHISQTTKDILDTVGGYATEIRGEITVKGKGSMVTYWLNRRKGRKAKRHQASTYVRTSTRLES